VLTTTAEENTIEQEKSVLLATCPVRWESLDVQLNFSEEANSDLWESEADRLEWEAYFSALPNNENITDLELQRVANDRLTIAADCAAQRVKVMLMLGGTPLGDAAVASLSNINSLSDEAISGVTVLGSRPDYPANSCLQIKDNHQNAESGYYWIKLGISPKQYHVYCEMEHEGGGWMYWGYIGANSTATDVFGVASVAGSGVNCNAHTPDLVIAPRSCRHILDSGNANGDGIYQVDLHGTGSTEPVWCDMTTDGGGWTHLTHKNTGTLANSSGHPHSVYYSGNAGEPVATESAEWFSTYKKCNSNDNCNATSNVDWNNPIGATELRLQSSVSGNGVTKVNGVSVVSIQDDSTNSCETHHITPNAVNNISGAIQVKSIASAYGGCGGVSSVSQVSVREPSGLCGLANDAEYVPPTAENTINVNYDKHRVPSTDTSAVNSVFALSEFGDSEMIFTLDSPSIQLAQTQNKYIRYRYDYDSAAFNLGPLPCQASGYEYTLNDQNFIAGAHSYCTNTYAFFGGAGGHLTLFGSNTGIYWGTGMGGNNSWYHPAWVYVR
jgi:hypothetical protein